MTTVDNVRKTFGILEQQGVRTMTIVTSRSHQQRVQGLYRVMARFYAHERGYAVQSVGNFCYESADAQDTSSDHRLAIQGMVELLHLPKDMVSLAPTSTPETGEAE